MSYASGSTNQSNIVTIVEMRFTEEIMPDSPKINQLHWLSRPNSVFGPPHARAKPHAKSGPDSWQSQGQASSSYSEPRVGGAMLFSTCFAHTCTHSYAATGTSAYSDLYIQHAKSGSKWVALQLSIGMTAADHIKDGGRCQCSLLSLFVSLAGCDLIPL
jgi:hypothetical protein